jgi:hypothetical protein
MRGPRNVAPVSAQNSGLANGVSAVRGGGTNLSHHRAVATLFVFGDPLAGTLAVTVTYRDHLLVISGVASRRGLPLSG